MLKKKKKKNLHPVQAILAGIVTVSVTLPVALSALPCATLSGVWPVASVLPVSSMSQVKGPVPLALRWSMVSFTLLPFVTCVTAPAASAFSVFSPTSMLPPTRVRPHSLTTLVVISASEMKFASVLSVELTAIL